MVFSDTIVSTSTKSNCGDTDWTLTVCPGYKRSFSDCNVSFAIKNSCTDNLLL